MDTNHLARVASIYAEVRHIKLTTLGLYLVRDSNFFERVKEGRVTVRRVELAARRLSEMWPAPLPWPADIPRPAPRGEDNRGAAA